MDRQFTENHHVIHAFPEAKIANNEDIFNGSPRSDIVSLHGAQRLIFLIITNSVSTGTGLIRADGCSSVSPGATCALTFHVRTIRAPDTGTDRGDIQAYTTLAVSDYIYEVEIDACQLPSCSATIAYEYARLTIDEVSDSPVDGAIVAILDGLRSAEDILPTQVT